MAMKLELEQTEQDDDASRSGVCVAARPPSARAAAREESTLALLEEIARVLRANEPDEGLVLHEFVGILCDIGLTCTLDVERTASVRERYGVGTREALLDDLIDRQVDRAQREGRAVWCCREVIAHPHGVSHRLRDPRALADLATMRLDWMLAVPIANDDHALGALTVYASAEDADFPSVQFVRNVAQLVGIAIANRRHNAAMMYAIERRDIAMANVAHDMKNPLSVIMMMTRIMRPLLGDVAGALNALDTVERHSRYMVTLVHDILESAVSDVSHFALKLEACDAVVIVADALTSFEPLYAGKELCVSYTSEPAVPQVLVDPARIMQVILNLVGNAIKFTPRGGTIAVRVEKHDDGAAFSVTDSGPGMTSEQIDCAFDRFWQADNNGTGTGLGLTIVHDIVEAHGGRVWVESDAGQGAKFTFTVPLAHATL